MAWDDSLLSDEQGLTLPLGHGLHFSLRGQKYGSVQKTVMQTYRLGCTDCLYQHNFHRSIIVVERTA